MIPFGILSRIIILAVVYLLLIPFQMVVFPTNYFSVREIIYDEDPHKALRAAACRLVFIAVLTLVCFFLKYEPSEVYWGVAIGSFLCVWPSIYHYQLFAFFHQRIKLFYFLSCVMSVVFTLACAWFSYTTLIPMIFSAKEFALLDNAGISFFWQLLGITTPFGIREVLERAEEGNPHMDAATFPADLIMTERKLWFERHFCEDYENELVTAAEKYNLSYELLTTIICLERINRKTWYMQQAERVVCRWFPNLAIKKNMSLGLAQISVAVAKRYYQQAPQRFLNKMLQPEESIMLCAFYLRELIDQFLDQGGWAEVPEVDGVCAELEIHDFLALFIASQYICGCNVSLKKYVLVYMTLLGSACMIDELDAIKEACEDDVC